MQIHFFTFHNLGYRDFFKKFKVLWQWMKIRKQFKKGIFQNVAVGIMHRFFGCDGGNHKAMLWVMAIEPGGEITEIGAKDRVYIFVKRI